VTTNEESLTAKTKENTATSNTRASTLRSRLNADTKVNEQNVPPLKLTASTRPVTSPKRRLSAESSKAGTPNTQRARKNKSVAKDLSKAQDPSSYNAEPSNDKNTNAIEETKKSGGSNTSN
jgi:hypothetical protein